MKGGITSGVVYPAAIRELAEEYRFVNIGGSSAGAIAAAVCAAAEYGRQGGHDGFSALDDLSKDLGTQGLLLGLFQPAAPGRPAFAALSKALDARADKQGALAPALKTLVWKHLVRAVVAALVAAAPLLALGAVAVVATMDLGFIAQILTLLATTLLLVLLVSLSVVGARVREHCALKLAVLVAALGGTVYAAVAIAGVATAIQLLALLPAAFMLVALAPLAALGAVGMATGRGVWTALNENDFGLCPGTDRDGVPGRPALIDWLDRHIQAAGGRTDGDPALTFGELTAKSVGVNLEMMTTDLSHARPVRVPSQLGDYLFDPGELRARFPERVVAQMEAAGDAVEGGVGLRTIDPDRLPILVGARLSLSFPGLLSAMPLHRPGPDGGTTRRHLLSDGGICSNFPIHFFDSWFPSRPTFGLDLASFPDAEATSEARRGDQEDAEAPVFIADPLKPSAPRWEGVANVGDFAGQIKDAMQNWRDALQSELPGFRERVCQIRLSSEEGGLNLNMDAGQIRLLAERGRGAGKLLREVFREGTPDDPSGGVAWRQNRWIRYLTLMQALQRNLRELDEHFSDFAEDLSDGLVGVTAYRTYHGAPSCESASSATVALGNLPDQWLKESLDFDVPGALPQPEPVMRAMPRV
jgi:hypothetical protein